MHGEGKWLITIGEDVAGPARKSWANIAVANRKKVMLREADEIRQRNHTTPNQRIVRGTPAKNTHTNKLPPSVAITMIPAITAAFTRRPPDIGWRSGVSIGRRRVLIRSSQMCGRAPAVAYQDPERN